MWGSRAGQKRGRYLYLSPALATEFLVDSPNNEISFRGRAKASTRSGCRLECDETMIHRMCAVNLISLAVACLPATTRLRCKTLATPQVKESDDEKASVRNKALPGGNALGSSGIQDAVQTGDHKEILRDPSETGVQAEE